MMKSLLTIFAAVILAFTYSASAYMVGAAKSLEEIEKEADIIFKGTCVSSKEIQDEWFKPLSGFKPFETEFRFVSVIKGEGIKGTLQFRHYDEDLERRGFMSYWPQWYHFEPGSTYLIFAKATGVPGVFRQLWPSHTSKSDQGAFHCADAEPVDGNDVKQVVWTELQKSLQSKDPERVVYGINHLDLMSNSQVDNPSDDSYDATKDFDRLKVLASIAPLMNNPNEEIALQAITAIGSRNPYMDENGVQYLLGTVGSRDRYQTERMNARKNPGGSLYHTELVSIVEGHSRTDETRALAVRALGLVRNEVVNNHLESWLKDAEAAVRSSAALLLAEVPKEQGIRLLAGAMKDRAMEVRINAAYAIGIAQHVELVEFLDVALEEPDAKVRRAASMSLLTFPPKDPKVAKIFKEHVDNKEFAPMFLNALAAESIEPYLEPIAKVVEEKTEPTNWGGGLIPAFAAWRLLFKYMVAVPEKELQSGKFDRYLDAMENGYTTGSSEPTKIYSFYLQRGMKERARKYREKILKTNDYGLYFDRVDADPKSESLP